MGGKPSKSTPKDMRLKRNNPNIGKTTPKSPQTVPQAMKQQQQKNK